MSDIIIKPRVLKSGKIVYEYQFEIASINGKRKRKTKSGFSTKTAALKAGNEAKKMYEDVGQVVESSSQSVSDFLDEWMEQSCKLTCTETTLKGYQKKIRLYIKPAIGSYYLQSITHAQLQDFITDMFNKGFSKTTISVVRGMLSQAFGYAEEHHYIKHSPANKLVIPKNLRPKIQTRNKPHVYIPQSKIKEIFDRFPEGTPAYIPLMLAYHCGLRLGEIYGVIWEDIDFEKKTLTVNRQVQWMAVERTKEDKVNNNGKTNSGGYWYFSEPKYKSYRIIDLDDMLLEILKKEYQKQQKDKEYYAEYYKKYYCEQQLSSLGHAPNFEIVPINKIDVVPTANEIHFICIRADGSFITPRTSQHISSVIHHELNYPEYDTHSLRHTHATMLMEQKVDMIYIQHRLGHKDISVTMNIYTNHMTDTIKENNNAILNNLYEKADE